MSMENSNGTIGNRTSELPAFSVVPQTAVQRLTPWIQRNMGNFFEYVTDVWLLEMNYVVPYVVAHYMVEIKTCYSKRWNSSRR